MENFVSRYNVIFQAYRRIFRPVYSKVGSLSYQRLQAELLDTNKHSRFLKIDVFGTPMELDLHCTTDIAMLDEIRGLGAYEPAVTSFVMDTLRPGSRFVDVGANSGYYTILASKIVGETGVVYAVEPSPARSRLERNVVMSGLENVRIVPYALWKENKVLPMYLSSFQDGLNSFFPIRHRSVIPVETVTFDSMIGYEKVDLVKVDAEGTEREVLMGASNSLSQKRIARIVVEWNETIYPTVAEVEMRFDSFSEIGRVYRLESRGRQGYIAVGPVRRRSELPSSCNLLIVPN